MADWMGVDMGEASRRRRPKGTGGIHFRASDDMWIGTVDLGWANGKRNRRRVASKSREVVEQRMAALLALPAELIPPAHRETSEIRGRDALILAADERGSHTTEQWISKRDAVGCCIYCGAKGQPLSVDHAIPLSRGGSNSLTNVVPACFPCNAAKGVRTAAEFVRERLLGLC